jgi:nitroimidazol reductase NimA-like FMN-containing flavoprotein (pyridoxamine 5'-phosphate oxidase superfamily)
MSRRRGRNDMTAKPTFRELTRAECEAVLARCNLGRIAFSYRDHVDIEPIHYVLKDQWIYGRTTSGTKLRTLAHNRWLAFEVDEVEALFEWKSVVVKGALYQRGVQRRACGHTNADSRGARRRRSDAGPPRALPDSRRSSDRTRVDDHRLRGRPRERIVTVAYRCHSD